MVEEEAKVRTTCSISASLWAEIEEIAAHDCTRPNSVVERACRFYVREGRRIEAERIAQKSPEYLKQVRKARKDLGLD